MNTTVEKGSVVLHVLMAFTLAFGGLVWFEIIFLLLLARFTAGISTPVTTIINITVFVLLFATALLWLRTRDNSSHVG